MTKKKQPVQQQQQSPQPIERTPIVGSLDVNEQHIHTLFGNCADVIVQPLVFNGDPGSRVLLVYCDGLTDAKRINETIVPNLRHLYKTVNPAQLGGRGLLEHWQMTSLQPETDFEQVIDKVFGGDLILFFDGLQSAYSLNIADPPERTPEDTNTEISIRGPRDGFIESLPVNVALIRKRLRTNSLSYEQTVLGKRSKTKVGLLYFKDIVRPELVREVKRRIDEINIDAVYSSSEIEQLISDSKYSIFPLLDYTGRPDFAVAALLRGRFVIIVDGTPTVIIAPNNLTMLFKSPEDTNNPFWFVSFQIIFRIVGLFISPLLPGLYIAIASFHPDQLPLSFLATLVNSRKGVPLPAPLEGLLMLLLFELFREAGVRMPHAIGQTLAVVGGLIIGDAAINAGLTSPTMLIMMATTAVATFTLVNQTLTGTVSIIRIGVMAASSVLGMFGFILSIFVLLISVAKQESFGVPLLSPISPFHFRDFMYAIFRIPVSLITKRPHMLKPTDATRQKENP